MVSWSDVASGYCDFWDVILGANYNWGECDITQGQVQEGYEEGNPYTTPYGEVEVLPSFPDLTKIAIIIGGAYIIGKSL